MKQHHLSGLNIDLPALEQTAEGQLRGGFAMLGPSKSPSTGINDECSNNLDCSGNTKCYDNGKCHKNVNCICSLEGKNPSCNDKPGTGA